MQFFKFTLVSSFLFFTLRFSAQNNYTSYFTGSQTDSIAFPSGGVCMMGGASEDDEAMKWFLNRANGGDVLVLRASGSDGYNNYLYSELGVQVNSVETIVFHNANASQDSYVHERIQQAEAIWFAGGNQWNYVSYWRDTPVMDLINEAIAERNIVIGGTSAGMAILGSYYYSAQNNSVTSSAALQNPYNNNVTLDNTPFLSVPFLTNVITDTHYDNPDRRGRHTVFLARMVQDDQIHAKGIACDEYTSVCIDENGLARVFGAYPQYDDNAYFIQANCSLNDFTPEICVTGSSLTWNLNGEAVKVYTAKGTPTGANTFDLTDWQTAVGGSWQHWSVENGVLSMQAGTAIDCSSSGIDDYTLSSARIFPNPAADQLFIDAQNTQWFAIYDLRGSKIIEAAYTSDNIDVSFLAPGCYFIHLSTANGVEVLKFVKE